MSEIPAPRLSDIEHYLLLENHPAFPLDFSYRLQFDQRLDLELLTGCLHQALKLHPLLSATLVKKGKHWFWAGQLTKSRITIVPEPDEESFRLPIDLEDEIGVRLVALEKPDGTCLVCEFHHTATDGLGAMGFISDLLQIYGGSESFEPTRDVSLLKQRHYCGYPRDKVSNYIRKHFRAIKLAKQFAAVKVFPLLKHQPDRDKPRSDTDCARFVSHSFSTADTAALRSHARSSNVSLNTLLIRDAFVTIDSVRQSFDGYLPEQDIRIAVPGDLRSTQNNSGFPAGNFFSMIFPHKNAKQIADEDGLLQWIHQEVKSARTDYFLAIFRLSLKFLRLIPGQLEREANTNQCNTTLLLTNVGTALNEVERAATTKINFGGVTLESIELVAPVRLFQSIAISTLEYAGEQTITVTYDPRIHEPSQAEGILQTYVSQLLSRINMSN